MLHRAAGSAVLLWGLLSTACGSSNDTHRDDAPRVRTEVVAAPPTAQTATGAPSGGPGSDRGKSWQGDDEEGPKGGFQAFKEVWVYVDGKPAGVMREAELPPMPETWVDEVEYLDFKAGDAGPHQRVFQIRRWTLADYFAALGIDAKKIKKVLLHGGRGTVFIDGNDFRRYRDKFTFDLAGNNNLKLRVYLPVELRPTLNTSFDRYAAISVIVDKPAPTTNQDNDVVIDGTIVQGIPYYGQPLRGGIRVYLDGRLAAIIKRNALGNEGRVTPGVDEWSVAALLAARGHEPARVAAVDIVDRAQTVHRAGGASLAGLTFRPDAQAQGAIALSDGTVANALLLWTAGHVPPVHQMSPRERDKPGR